MHGGVPKLRLKSRPVEGHANQELIKFLAQEYKTAPSKIKLIQGAKSRIKKLEIDIEWSGKEWRGESYLRSN